jgi:probable HAF family extracellular repeat protein
MTTSSFRAAAFAALCVMCGLASAAPSGAHDEAAYVAEVVDSPSSTGQSAPTALNARGQVVGSFFSPSAHGLHGFATGRQGAAVIDLCPALPYCGANSISARGLVAGFRREAGSHLSLAIVVHADGSGLRDVGTMGGDQSEAKAVNARGALAGQANLVAGGPLHAFVVRRPGGRLIDLGTLGGDGSQAWSMNALGDVVGTAELADGATWHAFVAPHGRTPLRDLGTLGGSIGIASHVNDSGLVVGGSARGDGTSHAFLGWVGGGTLLDLGSLGSFSFANSVNNQGTIVGRSDTPSGVQVAFVIPAGREMIDLNTVTTGLPEGVSLIDASDVSDAGEIAALGNDNHTWLLRPQGRAAP